MVVAVFLLLTLDLRETLKQVIKYEPDARVSADRSPCAVSSIVHVHVYDLSSSSECASALRSSAVQPSSECVSFFGQGLSIRIAN